MTIFEQVKPLMDVAVDTNLGDTISYDAGNGPIEGLVGFILPIGDDLARDGINVAADRWQGKIHKSLLPTKPMRAHRVRAALMGDATYQPGAARTSSDGDYWLFDLQRV